MKKCNPSAEEVGKNIRKIRLLRGYKQQWIANQLGITKAAISKIENGKTDISLSRLCVIAVVLKVEIKMLFIDPGESF